MKLLFNASDVIKKSDDTLLLKCIVKVYRRLCIIQYVGFTLIWKKFYDSVLFLIKRINM